MAIVTLEHRPTLEAEQLRAVVSRALPEGEFIAPVFDPNAQLAVRTSTLRAAAVGVRHRPRSGETDVLVRSAFAASWLGAVAFGGLLVGFTGLFMFEPLVIAFLVSLVAAVPAIVGGRPLVEAIVAELDAAPELATPARDEGG